MGILPLKAVLASTCIISMAIMLKLSLPLLQSFFFNELPQFWSLAVSWLRPPYLYLLINCIIISIVASSKLQQPRGGGDVDAVTAASEKISAAKIPVEIAAEMRGVAAMIEETKEVEEEDEVVLFGYVESPVVSKVKDNEDRMVSPMPLVEEIVVGDDVEERERVCGGGGDEVVVVVSKTKTPVVVESSSVSSAEKPPLSARFGHRRGVKSSPEGKQVLKVSRPKRRDTLESTWRTITDGRSMPLTRHLKKSDTFAGASPEKSPVRVMKKSDTFSASPPSSNGKMRREPSLSQDELNRRVEAFIKKFNEEMRLQRHDSVKQYREVVGHGVPLRN